MQGSGDSHWSVGGDITEVRARSRGGGGGDRGRLPNKKEVNLLDCSAYSLPYCIDLLCTWHHHPHVARIPVVGTYLLARRSIAANWLQ